MPGTQLRQKPDEGPAPTRGKAAHCGGPRPGPRTYGYEPGGTVVRHREALVVREIAGRLIAGESTYSIARGLNERGVPTARNTRWHMSTIKQIANNPRYAGLCVHLGGVVREFSWPAIISRQDHERIRTLVAPAARYSGHARRPVAQTLAGIARCGGCDQPMASGRRKDGVATYTCAPSGGGCGKVSVTAPRVDDYVKLAVSYALYGAGRGSVLDLGDRSRQGHSVAAGTDRKEASQGEQDPGLDSCLPDTRESFVVGWDKDWDVKRKRMAVGLVIDHVIVKALSPDKPRSKFDEERIFIQWRCPAPVQELACSHLATSAAGVTCSPTRQASR